jgi:hypothetical protein
MTEPEPPPLSPELKALLATEQELDHVPDALRAELRANLDAAMDGAARERARRSHRARLVQATGLAFAVGAASGALVVGSWIGTPRTTPAVAPAPTASSAVAIPIAPSTIPIAPSIVPPVTTAPVVASRSPEPVARAVPSAGDGLARERTLIDRGRAALARGDGSAALLAIDEHARRFPNGALAEERELLAVRALAATGQRDAMHKRAAAFRQTFPDSVFLSIIDGIEKAD